MYSNVKTANYLAGCKKKKMHLGYIRTKTCLLFYFLLFCLNLYAYAIATQ